MAINRKIFFTLFLAVFVTTMGVGLVAPLLPVYAHEMGAGGFQIGLIFGAFSLTSRPTTASISCDEKNTWKTRQKRLSRLNLEGKTGNLAGEYRCTLMPVGC